MKNTLPKTKENVIKKTSQNYFTQSLFKMGRECPTKIFYATNKRYANKSEGNAFLKALAEGTLLVRELAKYRYDTIEDLSVDDPETADQKTRELLKREKVVIFDGAIIHDGVLVRPHILDKDGNSIAVIIVKAKAFDPSRKFNTESGKSLNSKWKPLLEDLAFQLAILNAAELKFDFNGRLMLSNKNAICETTGLLNCFPISQGGKNNLKIEITNPESVKREAKRLLHCISINKEKNAKAYIKKLNPTLKTDIGHLVKIHFDNKKRETPLSSICGVCEFQNTTGETGLEDGFKECWKQKLNWDETDFEKPNILSLWNFRKKDELIADRKVLLEQLKRDDIVPKGKKKKPISHTTARQWLQVRKVKGEVKDDFIEPEKLKEKMKLWEGKKRHFIDFETTRVPIPFTAGRRPYELVAFQFSHHVIDEGGKVSHAGQFINVKPGVFPNYDFIRELKKQLEADDGPIFRYSHHENSTLVEIYEQLCNEPKQPLPKDAAALMSFIKKITICDDENKNVWKGSRNMIDLCELVQTHYYSAMMNGSNSIKKVLPAILTGSKFLKNQYGRENYGGDIEENISSKNFKKAIQWVAIEEGKIKNPYDLLPPLFSDFPDVTDEKINGLESDIREGGAALTAYARLQSEKMKQNLRMGIKDALLKYCELDTLAMVMIYQGWQDMLREK